MAAANTTPVKPRGSPVPFLTPPPSSPFASPFARASAAAAAAAAAAPPPAPFPPFAPEFEDLFAGVELVAAQPSASPPADASADAAAERAAAAAFSADPFAGLLDDVDDRLGTAKAVDAALAAAPLCAEAHAAWNVGVALPSSPRLMGTPPGESLLAALDAAGAPLPAAPDAVERLMLEESRRRLAAVRLPPAPWGPGSSLSPRQPPPMPGAVPSLPQPLQEGPPAERSLIDL